MPFAGQLIVSLQLAEGVTEYPVSAGQELAVVRNLNTILLKVPLEDVSWSGLPTGKLAAVISHLPDGTASRAPLRLQRNWRSQPCARRSFYYFQFPAGRIVRRRPLLVGTAPACELWLGLSQPARIVPKLALVLHEPDAFQNRHWNEGISWILPGAQVLVEGQTDLAILPPVPQLKPEINNHALSRAAGSPMPVN